MEISKKLVKGFQVLGFDQEKDDCLFLCKDIDSIVDLELKIHLEKAILFNADAIFFRKELERFKPQVYLYDFTNKLFNENDLTDIQKKVWSNGSVPIVCAFYDTEIKIIDCTQHIKKDNTPVYLANLDVVARSHQLYNEQFAIKIKTGAFWEELENKNKFKFNSSAYDILIQWIKEIIKQSSNSKDISQNKIVKKVIIQSIMIKYLEERKDEDGKSPFNKKYVKKYDKAKDFVEVLEKNKLVDLLEDLQRDLNGNLFEWSEEEKEAIKLIDLSVLSEALKAYKKPEEINNNIFELIRFYEFSYIPVELISRIYEEFLAGDADDNLNQKNKKKKEGIFYTPSHLAQLLVDESMPLKSFKEIDLSKYKVLDPACGSGIFLVLAYKRLVQWWRLQNNLASPKPRDLKKILNCIYGVDKEEQAIKLTAFSLCLALCDTLSPMQVISDLKFFDLTERNILYTDFFIDELILPKNDEELIEHCEQVKNFDKIKNLKFSLIIGNPPFGRSGKKINASKDFWFINYENKKIKIPSSQIALKFLWKSSGLLTNNGLQCLILKASSLLYNPTSSAFKKVFFFAFNVAQIFDFTPLARNKSLWDNGADVDTIALFSRNSVPNINENILHATFRRTKVNRERILFEIDETDLNYITRDQAINNPYVWKTNLVGGGRVLSIIDKLTKLNNFQNFLDDNKLVAFEGEGGAKSLNNDAFKVDYIEESYIDEFYKKSFKKIENDNFSPPNFLVKENISLPFALNKKNIPFSNEVICVSGSSGDLNKLEVINKFFKANRKFIQFYLFATSGKTLIYKNTSFKKDDLLRVPLSNKIWDLLNEFDKKIIENVNDYFQLFLRNGEKSKAVQRILNKDYKDIFSNYGDEFSKVLNLLYQENKNKFRLSQVDEILGGAYLVSVFKYDNQNKNIKYNSVEMDMVKSLTEFEITKHLSSKRIIRLYDIKDTIIIIKPNQYRYWLSLSAYRDADKSIIDLSKMGY